MREQADEPNAESPVDDDRLRLMFTCCHPALAREAQLALTLRLVAGLSVEQIARGLLKSEVAVGQRITRAKAKIASAHIPYRIPAEEDLPQRLDAVLSVLYLVFNEGYLPGGDQALRPDLTTEAIRLARLLHELLPQAGEATGLLALMVLTESRRMSRVSADGELVTLGEQDRGGWDQSLITEGQTLVLDLIAAGKPPGRYQLQAAISAVHCHAREVRDTDWEQLGRLYNQLFSVDPSPVVALNRAVVRAELDGPGVALAEMERLDLDGYHAWHATRADLLRRLGRSADARTAYDAALSLAVNPAEIRYLERRRASLAPTTRASTSRMIPHCVRRTSYDDQLQPPAVRVVERLYPQRGVPCSTARHDSLHGAREAVDSLWSKPSSWITLDTSTRLLAACAGATASVSVAPPAVNVSRSARAIRYCLPIRTPAGARLARNSELCGPAAPGWRCFLC